MSKEINIYKEIELIGETSNENSINTNPNDQEESDYDWLANYINNISCEYHNIIFKSILLVLTIISCFALGAIIYAIFKLIIVIWDVNKAVVICVPFAIIFTSIICCISFHTVASTWTEKKNNEFNQEVDRLNSIISNLTKRVKCKCTQSV